MSTTDIEFRPLTLWASEPHLRSVAFDRLNDSDGVAAWLDDHGAPTNKLSEPVVVMVQSRDDPLLGDEPYHTVALAWDCENPVAIMREAIATLELSIEALTRSGHIDLSSRNGVER